MSQDPFQEREAEKYANPIPSREFILEHLTKREKPASRDELAVELHIEGEEQLEGLRRRLRAMERDGQLVFTRRQCYALPERLDLVKGTVIGHRDGYGFLRVEGRKDDLYLSSEQMKTCIHGDQVLAQPLGADRKGRREARIVRVLVPKTSQIVGRYFTEAGVGFVVPDDSRLSFDILIPPDQIMGARMGFVVVVELTQRPTRRTKAVGKIVEVLGDNMGTGMAVDIALRTHEIPYIWPQAVEQQVAGLKEEVPEEAKRAVLICAIYRWSPLMAKTPVTLTMRFTARKNAAAAGVYGSRLPTSATMCALQRRWTEKRVTVVRRCTSLRRLSRCCRKCSLTVCVRLTRR